MTAYGCCGAYNEHDPKCIYVLYPAERAAWAKEREVMTARYDNLQGHATYLQKVVDEGSQTERNVIIYLTSERDHLAAKVQELEITVTNIREYCSYDKIVRLEAVAEAADAFQAETRCYSTGISLLSEERMKELDDRLLQALQSLRAGEGK